MNSKNYFTYILASKRNGTLYIGVTNDLIRRVYEHKIEKIEGFTKKYKINKLVWYEEGGDVNAAIYREKQLKKWNRIWKLRIIEEFNPRWEDLYINLISGSPAYRQAGRFRPPRLGEAGEDDRIIKIY
jgi:putative endonuclease